MQYKVFARVDIENVKVFMRKILKRYLKKILFKYIEGKISLTKGVFFLNCI